MPAASVAIIAGAGHFPFHVVQEAKRQGVPAIVIGLQGWADPSLAKQVEVYEELAVGQLSRLIATLKSHRVDRAILAGKVTKEILLDQRVAFDAEARGILSQATDASVAALLGAVAQRLASEGITLLDSSTFLQANLCPGGTLTSRAPTAIEQEDIRIGVQAARAIAALDIGQTVVVKRRVIVAVEALEGTDAAIRRAHALAGEGLVVVKTASPNQDRRFDLPIVGMDTMATLKEMRVSCLAVEAGATLLLERDAMLSTANAASICLIGITIPS